MPDIRLFPLPGALPRHPAVQAWFAARPGPLGALALHGFEVLRSSGPGVTELLHDGQPTAGVDGLALGYVNVFRAHVNLGFFLGASLDDPAGLLQGSGRFMRHVKLRPDAPVDQVALQALVARAYANLKAHAMAR